LKFDWNKVFIILGLATPLLVVLYIFVVLGHKPDPEIRTHPVPIVVKR
jgi:hypothetical protein